MIARPLMASLLCACSGGPFAIAAYDAGQDVASPDATSPDVVQWDAASEAETATTIDTDTTDAVALSDAGAGESFDVADVLPDVTTDACTPMPSTSFTCWINGATPTSPRMARQGTAPSTYCTNWSGVRSTPPECRCVETYNCGCAGLSMVPGAACTCGPIEAGIGVVCL